MTIRVTSTRAVAPTDANYAIGRLGFIPRRDANALRTAALNAGFKDQGNNEYLHQDGSWVKLEANGVINRGIGGVQLQGVPGGRQAAVAAQPAQPAPQAPIRSGVAQDTSRPPLPSTTWDWWAQNTALGKLPRTTAAAAPAQLARLGFANNGAQWVHPDGSWATVSGGRLALGWKGYTLGQLPFNNRTSAR